MTDFLLYALLARAGRGAGGRALRLLCGVAAHGLFW